MLPSKFLLPPSDVPLAPAGAGLAVHEAAAAFPGQLALASTIPVTENPRGEHIDRLFIMLENGAAVPHCKCGSCISMFYGSQLTQALIASQSLTPQEPDPFADATGRSGEARHQACRAAAGRSGGRCALSGHRGRHGDMPLGI